MARKKIKPIRKKKTLTVAQKEAQRIRLEKMRAKKKAPEYKNVHKWWIVDDGRLVIGWNENPSTGWSFPVLGELAFRRFYRATGLTLPLDTVHPTKIRLETHWNDDERVINEYQKFIDKLTSTISDSDVQMLEDVLAHQYQVGVSDECDNNAGEDL